MSGGFLPTFNQKLNFSLKKLKKTVFLGYIQCCNLSFFFKIIKITNIMLVQGLLSKLTIGLGKSPSCLVLE